MYATRRTINRPGANYDRDGLVFLHPWKIDAVAALQGSEGRLVATSENVGSLSATRIASATEQMNQISDDIRDAKVAGSSDHADAPTASEPADPEVAPPITVAVSAALRAANPKALDKPLQVETISVVDLSAEAGDGVQWSGEYDALAGRREKDAFVSQLVRLGYSPHEFRVTVRRVSPEGRDGTRQRYTVLVAQLRHGVPYRGKRYIGGHGAEWVDEFARDAATDFPRNVDPIPASGVGRLPG